MAKMATTPDKPIVVHRKNTFKGDDRFETSLLPKNEIEAAIKKSNKAALGMQQGQGAKFISAKKGQSFLNFS